VRLVEGIVGDVFTGFGHAPGTIGALTLPSARAIPALAGTNLYQIV
jgi:hypothetical protein